MPDERITSQPPWWRKSLKEAAGVWGLTCWLLLHPIFQFLQPLLAAIAGAAYLLLLVYFFLRMNDPANPRPRSPSSGLGDMGGYD